MSRMSRSLASSVLLSFGHRLVPHTRTHILTEQMFITRRRLLSLWPGLFFSDSSFHQLSSRSSRCSRRSIELSTFRSPDVRNYANILRGPLSFTLCVCSLPLLSGIDGGTPHGSPKNKSLPQRQSQGQGQTIAVAGVMQFNRIPQVDPARTV
jgi:hypothetical protein